MRYLLIIIILLFSCSENALSLEKDFGTESIEIKFEDIERLMPNSVSYQSVRVFVSGTTHDPIAYESILNLRNNAEFIELVISGHCINTCSLILLPLSDTVKIQKNGSILLTSSSLQSKVKFMADTLYPSSKSSDSVTMQEFRSGEEEYRLEGEPTAKVLEAVVQNGRSPEHLFLHSVAYGNLFRVQSQNCLRGKAIAIYLDAEYFDGQLYRTSFENHNEATAVKNIANEMSEFIIVEPYTMRILPWSIRDRMDRCF